MFLCILSLAAIAGFEKWKQARTGQLDFDTPRSGRAQGESSAALQLMVKGPVIVNLSISGCRLYEL